jgi:hypothetical protein
MRDSIFLDDQMIDAGLLQVITDRQPRLPTPDD